MKLKESASSDVALNEGFSWFMGTVETKILHSLQCFENQLFSAKKVKDDIVVRPTEFFTILPQYNNANIANCAFKIKNTSKVWTLER